MSADQPTATWYNSFFSDDIDAQKPQLDRFDFRRKLGEGRFGEVWLAFDKQLHREVAIKLAHPIHLPNASDTQVLMVEAKLMAAMDHPNIVPVFDVGQTSEGRVYIVSRFVDGSDLAERLKPGIQDLAFSVALIATVAEALNSAHQKGLVHRDIKPANILIEKATEKPYVADFGLAVRDDDVLRSSQLAGTPAYMSPEQAKASGERLDGRSDIFSLGCVLYQMLTGKRPFFGVTVTDVLKQIIHTEPVSPRSLNDRIPQALEQICLKSLQKNKSGRFATASDMAEALRQLMDIETTTDPQDLNMIGPYKIRRKIGEGGMGSVFEAEQSKPVRRRVALKIIRSELNSDEVQKRFEAERQALAMMDHPNIARVLDAGVTTDGRPYFAMELVKGIAITEYSDTNKLSLDDRLELFVQTCNAVQHAHQKGIIHRDIKPSNILVTQAGDAPCVKVIDFGLAKALHATNRLTEHTLVTEFGRVMGTLQYMSPEQAEMNVQDVDTRSDVYSLGVLLYELLTGSTPLDRESMKAMALDRVLAAIREQDPPRPSQRLSSLGQSATSITELRKTDFRKLSLVLKGDLDWIAMKALEKERTRRYDSPVQMAEDIQRYLKSEAVIARPPNMRYRLSKVARKYRLAVSTVVAFMSFLMIAAVISTWLAIRATTAEEQSILDQQKAERSAKNARSETQKAVAARAEADKARASVELERDKALVAELSARTSEAGAKDARDAAESALARSNFFLATSRWDESRVEEAVRLLDSIPEKFRSVEWYLARDDFKGSDLTCYGHRQSVNIVAFSPDGSLIATGGIDRTIRVWDATTGDELHAFGCVAKCVRFLPDVRELLTVTADMTIQRWDIANKKVLSSAKAKSAEVVCVSFSSDGAMAVSGDSNGQLQVWNTSTFELTHTMTGHKGAIGDVCFSLDDAVIASVGADRLVKVWDTKNGNQLKEFKLSKHSLPLDCVAISPDGKLVAASGSYGPFVWEINTGIEPFFNSPELLPQHNDSQHHIGRVWDIEFSPDGTQLATSGSDNLRLWDARTGKLLRVLKGHAGNPAVNSTAFSPDGSRLASVGGDNTLRLWNCTTPWIMRRVDGHRGLITDIQYLLNGEYLATAGADSTIRIWDSATFTLQHTINGHEGAVNDLALTPDGGVLASASADGTIKLWNTRSYEQTGILSGHEGSVYGVEFDPNGNSLVSCGQDASIRVWDVKTCKEVANLRGHTGEVRSIDIRPDGETLVSVSDDRSIRLWKIGIWKELNSWSVDGFNPRCVTFSPDGNEIAVGGLGATCGIVFFDSRSGLERRRIEGSQFFTQHLVYTSDQQRVIADNFSSVRIWDTANGDELYNLEGTAGMIGCVALNPGNTTIAAGFYFPVPKIWQAPKVSETRTFYGDTGRIDRAYFSRDGRSLFAADGYQKSVIHDLASGEHHLASDSETLEFGGQTSPDGRWQIFPSERSVVLVDQQFRNSPDQRMFRESQARFDSVWHQRQVALARSSGDLYSQLFHLGWLLKHDSENVSARVQFVEAIRAFRRTASESNDSQASAAVPPVDHDLLVENTVKPIPPLTSTIGWSGSISPTGEQLLVNRYAEGSERKPVLFACDLATDDCVQLVDGGQDESWSPDGTRIAVCFGDGAAAEISVMSIDGTKTESIGKGFMPSWSKDANKLYFMDLSTWTMMRCNLSAEPRTTEAVLSKVRDSFAQVSPDETRIVYIDPSETIVIADLKTRKTIASNSVAGMGTLMKTWNPDSTHVAFGGFKDQGLWIMNASTGKSIQLLEGTYANPRWSADGKRLSVDIRPKNQVEVFDISGVVLP